MNFFTTNGPLVRLVPDCNLASCGQTVAVPPAWMARSSLATTNHAAQVVEAKRTTEFLSTRNKKMSAWRNSAPWLQRNFSEGNQRPCVTKGQPSEASRSLIVSLRITGRYASVHSLGPSRHRIVAKMTLRSSSRVQSHCCRYRPERAGKGRPEHTFSASCQIHQKALHWPASTDRRGAANSPG